MLQLIRKARSFARAVWSFMRRGDVPLQTYGARETACYKCDQMACAINGIFCNACGCPRWALSDLRTKWRMADVRCPLNKW